jgi:serpin B
MNRKLFAVIPAALAAAILLVVGGAVGSAQPSRTDHAPAIPTGPGPASVPPTPAVAATNRLALKLLTGLGANGNLVFSPYSIQAALAMVDQGAAGTTASQIGHVLGSQNASGLAAAEATLAKDLQNSAIVPTGGSRSLEPHVLIANGLWVGSGLGLESPFQTTLASDFGASPATLPFGTAPDSARQTINGWIAQHTEQLIRNLLPAGSITKFTAMVLANALYLKAHWGSPFVKSMTADGPFYAAPGKRVSVPFMTQPSFETDYGHGRGYQAVELDYADSSLSMLAVMPAQGTLGSFQRTLTPASLGRVIGSLQIHNVNLRMPRVQLQLHTSLNAALSALGMPVAFSVNADFSGITKKEALQITDIEHGAVMKVDEAGTVAAAATGVVLTPTAVLGGPTIDMSLNHPYLLFLRDRTTGAILFAGRVADPAGS